MNEDRPRVRVVGLVARGAHGGALVGLAIIAIGVILLLDQEGIVRAWELWKYWPIILVVVGLVQMFRSERMPDRLWGVVELLFGIVFQLDYLGYRRFQFSHIWPLLVIGAGLWVLYAAFRQERPRHSWSNLTGSDPQFDLNRVDVLGGGKVRVNTRNFRGGRWVAIFGGSQLDFSEADMEGTEAALEIAAIFGGGEIIVPRTWQVVVTGLALFGGHNDETRPPLEVPAGPRKKLIIRGAWIFGGFNIKN
jgi:predicted membrane protein